MTWRTASSTLVCVCYRQTETTNKLESRMQIDVMLQTDRQKLQQTREAECRLMFWSKLITNQESDERLEQRIIWWWAPASSSVRAPRPLASTTANRPPLHMAPPAVLARRRSRRRHWGLPGKFSDFLFFSFLPDERCERRTCSPDVQVGNGALCWCRGSSAVLGVQGWIIQCSLLLLMWTQKHTRSEFRSVAIELKLHQQCRPVR